MQSHFFALISRLKYIHRWGLMHSTASENVLEHSAVVAMLSFALAGIDKAIFGRDVDPERAAVAALFHDITEVMTGDMPSPIKYASTALKQAYKAEEAQARERIFSTLPLPLCSTFEDALYAEETDEYIRRIVKAADKLAAYIKCVEESGAGNREFRAAETVLWEWLNEEREALPALGWFIDCFIESYRLPLDELHM